MEKEKTKIYQKGEKVLNQKAREVPLDKIGEKKFQDIIKKLERVIFENDEALAAAAPQVGDPWRIFAVSEWALHPNEKKADFKNIVFINPKITKTSKETSLAPESCLSAPQYYGNVKRAQKVKVEAYDENGEKFRRGASGLLAQVIQHATDHLDGILFVDKLKSKS